MSLLEDSLIEGRGDYSSFAQGALVAKTGPGTLEICGNSFFVGIEFFLLLNKVKCGEPYDIIANFFYNTQCKG